MFNYFSDMNKGGLLSTFSTKRITQLLYEYIRRSQKYNNKYNLKSGELLLKNINNFLSEIIKAKHKDKKHTIDLFINNKTDNFNYVRTILELLNIYKISPTIPMNLLFNIDHKLPYDIDNKIILKNIKFINNYYFIKKIKLSYKFFKHVGISNFFFGYMNNRNDNQYIFKQLHQIYLNLDSSFIIKYKKNKKKKKKNTNNRIKVLFISRYLARQHSVFKDRSEIIARLDKTKYDVYVITDLYKSNKIKKFWKSQKHINVISINFTDTSLKSLQKIILLLEFDIIVFCEIGMCFKQYLLAFSRLAPIQCNSFGHSDTSGIKNIDYFISSKYFETETSDEYYSEKLIKLDCLSMYYNNPLIYEDAKITDIKDRGAFIKLLKLSPGSKLYSCFNSFMKFSIECIETLNEILKKDKEGILLINFLNINTYRYKYSRYYDIFKKIFGKRFSRIVFMNKYKFRLKGKIYLFCLKNIDCICETFPFGGLNSTYDAIAMNQAVISLPSNYLSGRFTYGIYKKMGLDKTIAKNKNEYVNLAYKYANDEKFKSDIQSFIKKNKYKVFEEEKSVDEWNKCLEKLYLSSIR